MHMHLGEPREGAQQRRRLAHEIDRTGGMQRHPLARRELHLAAQVAAAADDRLQLPDPGVGRGIDLLELGARVGRGDDAVR